MTLGSALNTVKQINALKLSFFLYFFPKTSWGKKHSLGLLRSSRVVSTTPRHCMIIFHFHLHFRREPKLSNT